MKERRDWDGRKAKAGIRGMEAAEASMDLTERRALARASARYFWGSIGVERPEMDRGMSRGTTPIPLRAGWDMPR